MSGDLAFITTKLDVLPEVAAGDLLFIPLVRHGLAPQTISIAVDRRRPMTRAARIVHDVLSARLDDGME